MNAWDVAAAITAGEFSDSELSTISSAIRDRVGQETKNTFRQIVNEGAARFSSKARPTYLQGVLVQVVDVAPHRGDEKKVWIQLPDNAPGRALSRFGTGRIKCPVSILEPLS